MRSVLPNEYAAKARGIVLSTIAVGAVYVYYLAVDADDAIPPAAADFIPVPPVVRAASITAPIYVIPEMTALRMPDSTAASRTQLIRNLQAALANAHCYDGPVTGRWTAASQTAMEAFLATVNAHLPVDNPDEALMALISSNAAVTCPPKSAVVADALNSPTAAAYEKQPQTKVAVAASSAALLSVGTLAATPADERSMLDHPWARPEMLVPSAEMTPPASATTQASTSNSAEAAERDSVRAAPGATPLRSVEALPAPAVVRVSTAPSDGSKLRFEDGSIISKEKPEKIAPSPPAAASEPAKVAQRKTKAAKRRTSPSNDSSFGVSFDSIQRSLSSWFD